MGDLLEQAAGWLGRMRAAHLARPVTYSRGTEFVELSATLGRTEYEVTDDYGVVVTAMATDFLITADDLVLGGGKTPPQPGDRILLADGRAFEVMPLGAQGHFRPADPYGGTLRIHTKEVAPDVQGL